MDHEPLTTLNDVLDRLDATGADEAPETITVGEVLERFGDRTLAPILLVPALLTVSPLSGIPGVPTLSGLIMGLIVVQMLLGRERLWLPQIVARRRLSRRRMQRAVLHLRRPVSWLDGLLKPRLSWLAMRPWNSVALVICLGIVLLTPAMEFLPLAITIAAFAIALFAAGILVHDGVVILVGYGFVAVWAVFLARLL